MAECEKPEISNEDLRSALREIKNYVDITEEDLRKIYQIALRHAQERVAAKLLVRDVMTKNVISVRSDADLHDAARSMSEHRISGMPVLDEQQRVIGVISEADILTLVGLKRGHTFKDILRHLLGEPLQSLKGGAKVGDVMSAPAITIGPDSDIKEAAEILHSRRIKRLPVVDAESRLIGIISRADIVKAMGEKT